MTTQYIQVKTAHTHITNNVKLFFNKDVTDVVKMYLEATRA
jgi:hypothetical protein